MKISVIIATRNRKEDLKQTIEGFLRQTYKNFEIIVIDNASRDGTKEMMKNDFPKIKYLWLPDNINILAQNLGREMSDGEIIWRTDSDSFPGNEDAFQFVVDTFTKYPKIDVISGEEILPKKGFEINKWYPNEIDRDNPSPDGYPSVTFCGPGAAIKRKVFDKIGGFWEFGMEEIDFSTRAILAGFNFRYFPQVKIYHYSSTGDRNKSQRWLLINKQFLRYIWKYFPFFSAISSSFWVLFTAIIEIPGMKVKFLAILQSIFLFPSTILETIRNERKPIDRDQLKKITMGNSLAKNQRIYILNRIKFFLKKKK